MYMYLKFETPHSVNPLQSLRQGSLTKELGNYSEILHLCPSCLCPKEDF